MKIFRQRENDLICINKKSNCCRNQHLPTPELRLLPSHACRGLFIYGDEEEACNIKRYIHTVKGSQVHKVQINIDIIRNYPLPHIKPITMITIAIKSRHHYFYSKLNSSLPTLAAVLIDSIACFRLLYHSSTAVASKGALVTMQSAHPQCGDPT